MTAINFPDTPTANQVFNSGGLSWKWDATLSTWVSIPAPSASSTIQGIVYGIGDTTAKENSAFGYQALNSLTTGGFNTAEGRGALFSNTTGQYNTAAGNKALYLNTTGGPNTAFGGSALYSNTTASYNAAFGFLALGANTTGSSNVAIGNYAMLSNTTGNYNIAFGHVALNFNTTGNSNVALGFQSLYNNVSGNGNTALGYQAGMNETGSNKLYIANSNTSTPLIYGDFSTSTLNINGTVTAVAGAPTANTNTATSIGYTGIPQVTLASGGRTLVSSDAGKHIYVTGSGQTITVPANASVAFEIGTTIIIINAAAVTTTIAINSDSLIQAGTGTTGNRTLAAYGMATIIKISATSWMISGNGLS